MDGKDLRNATHDQAVEIIRHASNPVRFVVQSLGDPACVSYYSKTCVKWPLSKRKEIGFQYQLSLNAGQTYCRMLQRKHSAIHLTFI